MTRTAGWLLMLLVAGCQGAPRGDALHARLEGVAGRREGCLTVEVRDEAGAVLDFTRFPRASGDSAWDVAVVRGALPPRVSLQARESLGPCAGASLPNGASAPVAVAFDPARIVEVTLRLDAPDEDGDGVVPLTADGSDCDDAEPRAWPGAPEACLEAVDRSCDGRQGCADPTCPAAACARLPTRLVFPAPTAQLEAGACLAAVALEVQDPRGVPTPLLDAGVVTFTADALAGVRLFSDAACQVAATGLALEAGALGGTVALTGTRAGVTQVQAALGGLDPATLSVTITPGPAASLAFVSPPVTVVAPGCSAPLQLEARDGFGNATALPGDAGVTAPGLQLFTDSACSAPLGAAAPMPGTLYVSGDDEGTFTVTVQAGGASASQEVEVRRPLPAGATWRWPLVVSTGPLAPTGGYQGYTLTASFDLAGAADAGQAQASGGDLRVVFWVDGGWQEVDREVVDATTTAARVRFASQTALASNASDRRYSLVAGPMDGGAPLAALERVYLFADDFEGSTDGGLPGWTVVDGLWRRSTARARSGGAALHYPSASAGTRTIVVAPPVAEADVLFEVWWNVDDTSRADLAQFLRRQPGAETHYETNLENAAGWDLAWLHNGSWDEREANQSPPTADTWTRIGFSMVGQQARVWRDGVIVLSSTATTGYDTLNLGAGTVGLRKWDVGGAGVWFDDVTLRRYTEPEPTVTVGAPVSGP